MRKSILKTLVYADLFDFPLTEKELWQRLIWEKKTKPQRSDFNKALLGLAKEKKVKEESNFFYLLGRQGLVKKRKTLSIESKKKTKRAKRISFCLRMIPTIKMVGLTGSVAVKNAKREDDIDFFVVTSKKWLWTTRFISIILLTLLGVRRIRSHHDPRNRDKICLNMFLDEDYLDIFTKEKDVFLAYEISNLKLLWDRNNTYKKFLKANDWVKDFLPNI